MRPAQLASALARRIDAMTARERVILFVSIAVALVAVVDTLLLTPRAAEQKALSQELRARTQALDTLRRQIATADAGASSPAGRLLAELGAAKSRLAALDAGIAHRSATGADSAQLGPLLQTVLGRHERLTLMKLDTGADAPVRTGPPGLRGVELGVRGSYPDLAQYVGDLERTLPGLRWEELVVRRVGDATELQARVALLGERQ